MTDEDRYFIRQEEFWKHCRRLSVNRAICSACFEHDPRCFLGDQSGGRRIGDLLVGLCERCRRKALAPNDQKSLDEEWKLLKAKGGNNTRCYCGEDNPFCFEPDHLDGQKYSSLIFWCCINCHLKRTSRQLSEYFPDNFHHAMPATIMLKRVRGTIEYLHLIATSLRPIEDFLHTISIEETDSPQE